jgi:hypothetical protein
LCKPAGRRICEKKKFMKLFLCLLLVAGSPCLGKAQQKSRLFDAIPNWHPDLPGIQLSPDRPLRSTDADRGDWQQTLPGPPELSVRILPPDRMPCRVPNLASCEQMPVKRSGNADKMPNPLKGESGHPLYH